MAEFKPSRVTGDLTVTMEDIVTNNTVIQVGEQNNISQNTQVTVVTVPANGLKFITKIICTGEENARWDVYIDSVRKMTKRTIDRTVDFDFPTPLRLPATSVLDVKVTHHGPDAQADFQASVLGYAVI